MPKASHRSYVYESDEETSDGYNPIEVVDPRRRSRSRSRLAVRITDDRKSSPSTRPAQLYHHQSYQTPYLNPYAGHEPVIIENTLNVPQFRQRSSSTGAAPQPTVLPVYISQPARDSSRERVKHYHHHYSESSSDGDGGSRRSRRRSSRRDGDALTAETVRRLAELEIQKQELKYLKERRHTENYSPAMAAKLAELEALTRRRDREEEEAAIAAKVEARRKREDERIEREKHQALLEERERIAKKSHDAKVERERILAEEKVREHEAETERERIIAEEEHRKKRDKEKEEALRKRILAEEAERIAKEKSKKKEEEEEFNQKVRERFMRAGYSPDYIDDILEQKQLTRTTSRRTENQLAIEMGRPTFIRVQEKHLLPETLDYYRLPWDYDPNDRRYIIIKQYITHEFQQELFKHTERVIKRRETRLITGGYVKDTVTTTTLKPKNDTMFLVRRKSDRRSKSPMGRNWMFT